MLEPTDELTAMSAWPGMNDGCAMLPVKDIDPNCSKP